MISVVPTEIALLLLENVSSLSDLRRYILRYHSQRSEAVYWTKIRCLGTTPMKICTRAQRLLKHEDADTDIFQQSPPGLPAATLCFHGIQVALPPDNTSQRNGRAQYPGELGVEEDVGTRSRKVNRGKRI